MGHTYKKEMDEIADLEMLQIRLRASISMILSNLPQSTVYLVKNRRNDSDPIPNKMLTKICKLETKCSPCTYPCRFQLRAKNTAEKWRGAAT